MPVKCWENKVSMLLLLFLLISCQIDPVSSLTSSLWPWWGPLAPEAQSPPPFMLSVGVMKAVWAADCQLLCLSSPQFFPLRTLTWWRTSRPSERPAKASVSLHPEAAAAATWGACSQESCLYVDRNRRTGHHWRSGEPQLGSASGDKTCVLWEVRRCECCSLLSRLGTAVGRRPKVLSFGCRSWWTS